MATTRLIWRSAFGSFRWRRRLRFAYPPHDVVLSWVVRVDCPSRLGSEREQSALPAKSAPERVPTLNEGGDADLPRLQRCRWFCLDGTSSKMLI
jgi:hypothetical protein